MESYENGQKLFIIGCTLSKEIFHVTEFIFSINNLLIVANTIIYSNFSCFLRGDLNIWGNLWENHFMLLSTVHIGLPIWLPVEAWNDLKPSVNTACTSVSQKNSGMLPLWPTPWQTSFHLYCLVNNELSLLKKFPIITYMRSIVLN